ncbi:MAG TPA: hypothetical protein VKC56_10690 [Gallionellaceae bacterium]|nr:hypothetical protein [Gallionellaceae bacterium]
MGSFTFANLFGGLLFGGIGFVAFVYGKKRMNWKPMVIGAGLMAYPYFIASTALMYVVGIVLCTSLYVFRE